MQCLPNGADKFHYSYVIMGAKLFVQAQIKENIKAPRHWPLCGGFTSDQWIPCTKGQHYDDVIMNAIASQITSLTIVYSIVYSDADQRNIKAPHHWPLSGESTADRWIPRTNGQLRGKCFHLMPSSWVPWKIFPFDDFGHVWHYIDLLFTALSMGIWVNIFYIVSSN